MGWCAGSNMGGTGKHNIYKERSRIIFCERCESYYEKGIHANTADNSTFAIGDVKKCCLQVYRRKFVKSVNFPSKLWTSRKESFKC